MRIIGNAIQRAGKRTLSQIGSCRHGPAVQVQNEKVANRGGEFANSAENTFEIRGHLREWRSLANLQDYVGGRLGMSFLPSRKLVFVVDDDAAVLRAVKRLLRQYGY